MGNVEKFPDLFQQWQAAGGVEDHFTAHLVGIGAIPPSKEALLAILRNIRVSVEQLEQAISRLPLT